MSLIRKHGAVLQAWACLDLLSTFGATTKNEGKILPASGCCYLLSIVCLSDVYDMLMLTLTFDLTVLNT